MAVTASGYYGQTLIDALDASQLAIDWTDTTAGTGVFCAMCDNTATPDFNDTTPYFQAGGSEKDNEVSGTAYTAGGDVMAGLTLTISGGTATYAGNNQVWSSSSIVDARAAIILDQGATNDDMILLSDFGADYTSTNGDFTIDWSGAGVIGTIDYTP